MKRRGIAAVNFLHYELSDYDAEMAYAVHTGMVKSWPVVSIRSRDIGPIRSPYTAACLMTVAKVAGVALIWEGGHGVIVGNKLMIERWETYKPAQLCLAAAVECLMLPEPAIAVGRDKRVDVNRLRHKVAELYPTLRIWGRGGQGPEVELRWREGGTFLGGEPWSKELYTTGELCDRLGVTKMFSVG